MTAGKKHLLVTINDDALDKMERVVARLKKAGLTNIQTMDTIGIVYGDAAPLKVASLSKVSGVRAVEESAPIQLAPPDDPIQ